MHGSLCHDKAVVSETGMCVPCPVTKPTTAAAKGAVSQDLSEEFGSLLLQIADSTLESFDVRH